MFPVFTPQGLQLSKAVFQVCLPSPHCHSWDSEEKLLFASVISGVLSGIKIREGSPTLWLLPPSDLHCGSAGVNTLVGTCRGRDPVLMKK